MAAPVITFLSDYGLEDDFVGVCHGVMATICPEARVIDIAHGVARHNVRANIIHPGIVETPMQAPYLADANTRRSFEESIPLRRIAHLLVLRTLMEGGIVGDQVERHRGGNVGSEQHTFRRIERDLRLDRHVYVHLAQCAAHARFISPPVSF